VEEGGTLAPRSLTPDLEETWMRPALEAEGAARGQRSHSKSGEESWAGGGSRAKRKAMRMGKGGRHLAATRCRTRAMGNTKGCDSRMGMGE
jgi:hypothetical protein